MTQITASVGKGGKNKRNDVVEIQKLINMNIPIPWRPLVVDGVCGVRMISAIEEFQRRAFGQANSDGRVDPGGPTLRSLDGGSSPRGAAAQPAGQPAAQSPPPARQPAPNAAPGLNANVPARQGAFQFFVDRGWSREQAAGIVANLAAESNLNPAAVGDGQQARGIAQWHPDRQTRFFTAIGTRVQDATLEQQLRFVHVELTSGTETGAGNRLRGATTAEEAGRIVSRRYERPADADGEATRRGNAATQLLRTMPP